MKKLIFISFLFLTFTLENKASWTGFYGSFTEEGKQEMLPFHPLLRIEVRRYEMANQNYFDIEVYSFNNNNIKNILRKKDQNLQGYNPIREEVRLGQEYNNKTIAVTLDNQSNFLDITNEISLDHNLDIVTNMRLRFLKPLSSSKQVRLFAEHEVTNSEHIKGNPLIIMNDRSLLKKILSDHIAKNPHLTNSSCNKDIVVFLGKTGSGKSTLINYLSNKSLRVDEEDNIVLSNPSDLSAMSIGTSSRSETMLPKFTNIDNLIVYDLPGFGDTRGTSVNLANACFIKNIIEKANTVKLVFITGYDEVTAGRGALLRELSDITNNLLPNNQIRVSSSLIITKSPADKNKARLIQILQHKTDPGGLDIWINQERITKMSSPFNQQINQDDRQDILNIIRNTPPNKISNVNIQAVYNSTDLDHLAKIYSEEIYDNFVKLRDENFIPNNLSSIKPEDLIKIKNFFKHDVFFQKLLESLAKSNLVTLLKPISDHIYTAAWNSKQRDLAPELLNIENKIEEEITNRKRNLLVSPKEFVETLVRIADISELLKKSQVNLLHKKLWTTEVLDNICNRNYLLISKWLGDILSKPYDKLNEYQKTYQIPEVFGKDKHEQWVYYSKPILYKLIFTKVEDSKAGWSQIQFIKYDPLTTKREPVIFKSQFKYTRHTEQQNRALQLDPGYQQLFQQERELNQKREDSERNYTKQRDNKYSERERREKSAEVTNMNVCSIQRDKLDKGEINHREYVITTNKADEDRRNSKDRTDKWYEEELLKIDRNEENDRNKRSQQIDNIRLKQAKYENETYPPTTTIDSKEKQINDIIEQIIKPNFNYSSFIEAIEFEDTLSTQINAHPEKRKSETDISAENSNKKAK